MLPEDIQDLIIATALLLILLIIGKFIYNIYGADFSANRYISKDVDFNDEEKFFLLNFLRAEAGTGGISELISKSEGETNLISLQEISESYLGSYFGGRNYIMKVQYSDGKVRFITASHAWGLPKGERGIPTEKQKKFWFELGDGEKFRIPSLKQGLITIELKVEK